METIGYDPNNIMVGIHVDRENENYTIPSGSFRKYHLDEPLEHSYPSMNEVINIANSISDSNPQAKLFLSSWKKTGSSYSWGYSTILSQTSNTRLMCDQYNDGSIWCGNDQTPYWTSYKNYYGSSKVKSHWISLLIDGEDGDFNMLFEKANSLAVTTLWIFAANKTESDYCNPAEELTESKYNTYLSTLTYFAFMNGWLRKFINEYKYVYHCPEAYGDRCYCQENGGWELEFIQYLGTREVYP